MRRMLLPPVLAKLGPAEIATLVVVLAATVRSIVVFVALADRREVRRGETVSTPALTPPRLDVIDWESVGVRQPNDVDGTLGTRVGTLGP